MIKSLSYLMCFILILSCRNQEIEIITEQDANGIYETALVYLKENNLSQNNLEERIIIEKSNKVTKSDIFKTNHKLIECDLPLNFSIRKSTGLKEYNLKDKSIFLYQFSRPSRISKDSDSLLIRYSHGIVRHNLGTPFEGLHKDKDYHFLSGEIGELVLVKANGNFLVVKEYSKADI